MAKISLQNFFKKIKLNIDNILFYSIVFGVLLLSAGVYIMGSGINRPLGRDMIILGSGIFYISVIIFTFRLE
jgi:hypothetical protein